MTLEQELFIKQGNLRQRKNGAVNSENTATQKTKKKKKGKNQR